MKLLMASLILMSFSASEAPAKNRRAKPTIPPPVELSTRENAEQEMREAEQPAPAPASKSPAKSAPVAPAATTTTMTDINPLQLQDTYAPQEKLSYWSTSFTLERYSPVGKGAIVGGNEYSLNQVSTIWLPTLSGAYNFAPRGFGTWSVTPSLEAGLSYMSQPLEVETPTQSQISGQLNTTRVNFKPRVLVHWPVSSRIQPRVGLEVGQLFASYAANSSLARWTESISYFGYSAGLTLRVTSKWVAFTDFSERQRLDEDKDKPLDLQARAVEMGVSYIW